MMIVRALLVELRKQATCRSSNEATPLSLIEVVQHSQVKQASIVLRSLHSHLVQAHGVGDLLISSYFYY